MSNEKFYFKFCIIFCHALKCTYFDVLTDWQTKAHVKYLIIILT